MPGEFEGKIVVISGASRGIGRGIALAFAQEGAQTVLASSSEQNLAAAAKVIGAEGPQPLTVAGDLRTLAACEQLFNRVNERFRGCDARGRISGLARCGLARRFCAEIFWRGAAHPAVLAAVEGLARKRDQYR